MMTFQLFVGFCKTPMLLVEHRFPKIGGVPPPVLPDHVRHLELSLTPNLEHELPCADRSETPKEEDLHDAYDFHWLRLDKFQNLRSVNIWMAARGMDIHPVYEDSPDPVFVAISNLNIEPLRRSLANFGGSFEVTLSTPLHEEIAPEDGYVEGIAPSNVRLWKRGTGDWYHPYMSPSAPTAPLYGNVYAGPRRYVYVDQCFWAIKKKCIEIFYANCPLSGRRKLGSEEHLDTGFSRKGWGDLKKVTASLMSTAYEVGSMYV